jgi:hypothetical protein
MDTVHKTASLSSSSKEDEMSRHAKPKTNLQKFLDSPFMTMVWIVGIGLLFGYVIAEAILAPGLPTV